MIWTKTLTFGTHKALYTRLTDCIYQLLYHKTTIVSEKSIVFNFFPYKSIGDHIWPCRKIGWGQSRGIILTNLELAAAYQVSWLSLSISVPEKILKGFYHIWAWGPSWSCDINHLYTHFHSPSHGGSTWNLASISLAVSKEKKLRWAKTHLICPKSPRNS